MNKVKLVFYGILAALLIGLGAKLYSYVNGLKTENTRLHTDLIGKDQKYQQLSQYVAKLEIQYKNEDDLRKDAEKEFNDQIGELKDRIKILSDATFLIKSKARETNNSDVIFDGKDSQFVLNELRYDNGPPVGYVLIFKDGRVVSKLYNHEIDVKNVVTKNEESGKYEILAKADYVLKSPSLNQNGKSWLNQPYNLDIAGGMAEVDPTEPLILKKSFYWWNPRLNINLNSDLSGMYPGLGLSLMSYGNTKNDSDFKFLEVGLQGITDLQPMVVPVMWRPFPSFLGNTYIGPGAYLDGTKVKYFLGLQVGL